MNTAATASRVKDLLELGREPVAVAFLRRPPAGVPRVSGQVAAGCAFWLRAEAEAFYTWPEDHANCPIGTLTMGFHISADRQAEAEKLFATLCNSGYVTEAELAEVPKVAAGHRFVLYAPLRAAPVAPDIVIVRGQALQAMMLFEAGRRLKMEQSGILSGRPTCGAIPRALAGSSISVSTGCTGARIHAQLAPAEMIFALPGKRLEEILAALEQVRAVNRELTVYHEGRRPGPAAPAPA